MRLDVHIHLVDDGKLDLILAKLDEVLQKEENMDADVQAIIDQAQKNTDAESAADGLLAALFVKLQQAITAAPTLSAADRTTLQAKVTALESSRAAMAAAIVANTPAA